MNQITEQISAILLAVVGVAILATLVSKNANTAGVLQAGGNAFSAILGAATAPVTGGGVAGGFGLPNYGIGAAGGMNY